MKAPVDQIGAHTATGASATVHELGAEGTAGQSTGIANPTRHVEVYGTFTGTVKIQGSMDGTNWTDWITGITAPAWHIIPDGPRYIRSNCTAYTNGTISVQAQKFVEE